MNTLEILVVDDDFDFAESLGEVLSDKGHKVTIAHSGEEAIEIFQTSEFDLTFMDIKLPGVNGVESVIKIRSIRPTARCYMMTAYSTEQLLQQAITSGVLGIMSKPINIPKLFGMLEKVKPNGLVLVVDDDEEFSETLKDALASIGGYNVILAANAEQAFAAAKNNSIDVMLLDLRLPVLNGVEIYMELVKLGYQFPTIIITAYLDEEDAQMQRFNDANITLHITKPFEMHRLLSMIDEITLLH